MKDLKGKTSKSSVTTNVILEGGRFCLDIAKLVFGGVILAGLMKQDLDFLPLFLVGFGVVVIFALLGFILISKSKK